jgi:hypothetical protein
MYLKGNLFRIKEMKKIAIIKSDYYSALADFGVKHKDAFKQSINNVDLDVNQINGLKIKPSTIHGKGVFSTKKFAKGETISIGRKGIIRTLAGRYTNHSPFSNAVFMKKKNNIILKATKKIKAGEEITVDYRDSLSLQIQKPNTDLIVNNKNMSVLTTGRVFLQGVDAAAYDLLLSGDHINNLTVRERVVAFENVLKKLPQAEIPTEHEFIKGMYRRQITFPKGTFATGRIHRDDHMDVVLSGEMIIVSEGGYKHIKGPCTLTSRAGRKKAGYALTECVWCTYHPTKKTTVEEVEKELFTADFEDIEIKKEGGEL